MNRALAVPQVIRVDGSVFDSAGVPVSASKDMQIKAYDSASGGSLLWTSSVYNTVVSAGKFTVNLEASSGSPSLVDRLGERTASQAVYFQIEVDSGAANGSMDTPTVVLPRIRAKGTAFALASASADALKGVTTTVTEMNRLAGITANVQTQINTLSAASSAASKVDKAGDSMSGSLNVGANITSTGTLAGATLNSTSVTASRFALFDSSKNLTSSASSVTDTEFGYLSGVTANLGANLNGLTANVQTQLNAKQSSLGYSPVSKLGDSMSGALQVGANITSTGTLTAATINGTGLTASRALVTDGSNNLSSSSVTSTELGYLSGVTGSIQTQLSSATSTSVPTGISTGRLTVVSATPVPDTDQSARSTLYLTSGVIDLWDGSQYVTKQYDEKSISLAGATVASRMYAVYAYLSSGAPALELEAWTNNTTRATALVQDTNHSRIKYKSGAKDRRWVGDVLTNATGAQTDDTLVFRGVFNAHNRTYRPIRKFEATNSWSYSTDSWRAMNNDSTNNRATICTGDATRVNVDVAATGGHSGTGVAGVVGVGVNSTTSDAGSIRSSGSLYYGYDSFAAVYRGYLSPGANIIYPLETGGAGTTFYGDNGGTTVASGMIGDVEI